MAPQPPVVIILSVIIAVIAVIMGMYLGHSSKKFLFGQDYKKVKAETPLAQIFSREQKIIILIIPFCIALIFVILYHWLSQQKFPDFLLYGFASTIPNLIFIFIMFYFKKKEFVKQSVGNYLIAIVYILTVIIPFFSYFVFISLVFSGCQVPFKF